MIWLSKAMAILLALIWLPVASHCSLEHLAELEFLACAGSEGSDPHESRDCRTDSCATIESGHYKAEQSVSHATPGQEADEPDVFLSVEPVIPLALAPQNPCEPVEFPPAWQVVLRMALPPRPPSAAS